MTPLSAALSNRLRSHLNIKLLLLFTLGPGLTLVYFAVQRIILFPARHVPSTWVDRAIPFQPEWVWIYLSLHALNPIAPMLTRSRELLIRYTRGTLFLFSLGFLCFVFFPVAAPRPNVAPANGLYGHLIQVDRVYNSFPSLHATCAVYGVLYAGIASRDSSRARLRATLLAIAWIWVGLILYSTIATRQHFFIDLPAGVCLAWLASTLLLRQRPKTKRLSRVDSVINLKELI